MKLSDGVFASWISVAMRGELTRAEGTLGSTHPTGAVGAEPAEVVHGGSAIIQVGKVIAEAITGDDELLCVDIDVPVPQPEPREALPTIPPMLTQRVAYHKGEKPSCNPDYPEDLS